MRVKLGEVCTIKSSKRVFEKEYVNVGVPFIRGQEISDGSIKETNTKFQCYISKERFEQLKNINGVPKVNDILITAVGTIGNLFFVDRNFDFYFKDGNVIWLTEFSEKVNSKYLYFFMKSKYFYKQLECAMIGAVQKALTMVMLSKVEFELPNYNEQTKIANLLEKIEKKIDSNNKINTELEKIAKTIYDYWFLQFEFPNEKGKPYKSSGGKIVWNEEVKQGIPEGWKIETLNNICMFKNGINYNKNEVGNKKYKIVNVRDITASSLVVNKFNLDNIFLNNIQADNYLVEDNDILIARSGTPGAVRILSTNKENIVYCGFIISMTPINKKLRYLLTYNLKLLEGSTATKTGGSILQNVSQETLKQIKAYLPQNEIIEKFNEKISTIIDSINCNMRKNEKLSKLKDYLLPLLMNGQVGFKEMGK